MNGLECRLWFWILSVFRMPPALTDKKDTRSSFLFILMNVFFFLLQGSFSEHWGQHSLNKNAGDLLSLLLCLCGLLCPDNTHSVFLPITLSPLTDKTHEHTIHINDWSGLSVQVELWLMSQSELHPSKIKRHIQVQNPSQIYLKSLFEWDTVKHCISHASAHILAIVFISHKICEIWNELFEFVAQSEV